MDHRAEAQRLERTAEQYCKRGLHAQAADCWHRAAVEYDTVKDYYRAGFCDGQGRAERRAMRPTMPVNRSALVD